VLNVIEHEAPDGVIVQLGGQTPLKLARGLEEAGVPIWGTPAAAIHAAEDRDSFHELCRELDIPQPLGGVATRPEEAAALAEEIGYRRRARPSERLGGARRGVVGAREELDDYLAVIYAELPGEPSILVDDYVEGAV